MNYISAILLILTSASALAQAPPLERKPGFRTLGCRISAEDLFYESAEKLAKPEVPVADKPVKIFDSTRSGFHDRVGGSSLRFFRKLTGADGKPSHQVVAEADLSKGGSLPLILFIPDPSRPGILKTLVIEDDGRSFPTGSCRFLNLTPVSLTAGLGESTATVPPSGTALIRTVLGEKTETRFATVTATSDGTTHRLYSNNWAMRPGTRALVLVYAVGGQAEVHRIADSAGL
jgi:hypothetical protein